MMPIADAFTAAAALAGGCLTAASAATP